jgi:hypothetical protein
MTERTERSPVLTDCCDDEELLDLGRSMRAERARQGGDDMPFDVLDGDVTAFRAAFDAGAGQPRIVMLVSPTCGLCLRGAEAVHRPVQEQIPGAALRLLIVWVPVLGATEVDVPLATRFVPHAQASHFWDADGTLAKAYRARLGLGEDAWDVYLLYGPNARWTGDQPPTPDFWMHQLGSIAAPRAAAPHLAPDRFARKASALLGEGSGPGVPTAQNH